ncbi:terpenoid cyclases/protein prenyltransferase alpha-alpha toroid [Diaporthe sp. PMI_573]|nr:terpenoid cyclases/protein prenyltransferase alpha-alpha toroid [Diaporthaceae sp. PMI_573]
MEPPFQDAASTADMFAETSADRCRESINSARQYAAACMKTESHWSGEVRSNATITAEYVFLLYALQINLEPQRLALIRFLESEQRQSDGSWGIAPDSPGDVSVSIESYFALKLLGVDPASPQMTAGRDYIRSQGGMTGMRFFTRIYMAMFGLLPWDAVPQLAPELILIPSSMPCSIYRFSSWARITLVPLLVLAHHKPIFALPNGHSAANNFLDELWHVPEDKNIPYAPPFSAMVKERNWIGVGAKVADAVMYYQSRLPFPTFGWVKKYAVQRCMSWILERQEPSGDWAGIFPSLHASILAMYLEGIALDDPRLVRAIETLETFAVEDHRGKRIQPCVSAGWDTALMTTGLLDSCPGDDHGETAIEARSNISKAVAWMKSRQLLGSMGDWRVYRPFINSGGFAFEYNNSWYPDIDDTSAVIIALVKADPTSITSESVIAAVEWELGMQNSDGGWAGFDCDNNHLYLNRIPFSDMEAFCDPSTADVTGGVVEAFGLILRTCTAKDRKSSRMANLLRRMEDACDKGLDYIVSQQESDGSWYGRWGVNYLYGTTNVLWGLEHFHGHPGYEFLDPVVSRGIGFLSRHQNADGGWGESAMSYTDDPPKSVDKDDQFYENRYSWCESNPSQTAWSLMALLAFYPASDQRILRGMKYLLDTQTHTDDVCNAPTKEGVSMASPRSWPEPRYTATGFPGHMMLSYEYYKHYFPMMAIGRFLEKRRAEEVTERG